MFWRFCCDYLKNISPVYTITNKYYRFSCSIPFHFSRRRRSGIRILSKQFATISVNIGINRVWNVSQNINSTWNKRCIWQYKICISSGWCKRNITPSFITVLFPIGPPLKVPEPGTNALRIPISFTFKLPLISRVLKGVVVLIPTYAKPKLGAQMTAIKIIKNFNLFMVLFYLTF